MKAILIGMGLAAAVSTAALAASVDGTWRTPVHDALIQVFACGDAICGRVLNSDLLRQHPEMRDVKNSDPAMRDKPIKGMVMMRGFIGGPIEWKGGEIYNPDDGHTYHGSISLADATTLRLTGCVVFPLCRTQVWRREP